MTFGRANVIAWMTALITRLVLYPPAGLGATILLVALITAIFGLLWRLHPDPLPGAVRKGLEDFAKEYRR